MLWNEPYTYVDIVFCENNVIVGYAVVELSYYKGNDTTYQPVLLKSVSFISPNKEYQNITLDYVQERCIQVKEQR